MWCIENETFRGFEEQEVQQFEQQQQSLVEGKSPFMHTHSILYNMHLIHCIYFIACINLDGFLLRIMTSTFELCLVTGLLN
jgi:hypothetical protein